MNIDLWFVVTGNNELPVLTFTSRGFADMYCNNNPGPRYRIYHGIHEIDLPSAS